LVQFQLYSKRAESDFFEKKLLVIILYSPWPKKVKNEISAHGFLWFGQKTIRNFDDFDPREKVIFKILLIKY
jgi:hypothetical protein